MKIIDLFKRKSREWRINDECYIWQWIQAGDNEDEYIPVQGVITKLFKNGKIGVYLYKSRRSVHVMENALRR